MRTSGSLTLVSAVGMIFLLLSCQVQLQFDNLCIILLYFNLSCLAVIAWRPILFF